MPLNLAEQGQANDGGNDSDTSSSASPTIDDDITQETMAKKVLAVGSCRHLPNGSDGTAESKESLLLLDAEHGKGVGGTEASGTDKSRSSCTVPRSRCRRRIASRARICGLLIEKGARRSWRRAPSEQQVALHKKYAALLEDDDGRNLCTFSG